jgi:hypothetical protein
MAYEKNPYEYSVYQTYGYAEAIEKTIELT